MMTVPAHLKNNLFTILSIVVGVGLISAALFIRSSPNAADEPSVVRFEGDTQVIRIEALGGYSPRSVTAQADMPTRLEIATNGTYDCSSAIAIPVLGIRSQLPPSGVTALDIAPQAKQKTITGTCSMGMYSFSIRFE